MTRVRRLLVALLLLTICGAALPPAMAQQQPPSPVAAPVNPFLYPGSAIAMGHWDPQQSDISRLPMPTGNIKSEALDVRFVPGNLINWATAHAPKPGGPEIAWFSGPAMVGTVRLDGGRFELLHTLAVPGYEHLALKPERMRQLVADLDAAGADEAKLRATFLQGVKEAGISVATMFNGAYTVLDKDGHYFAVYGTGLYKFGYKDPADPLSGIQLVKSLDLKAALPADLAATVSRVIGINLTADGRIAFAMSGLVGVVDRELGGLQFIPIAGEAIDNNLAADAQGGLYVVTDKFMRKLVWNGKQLSADEADGAWKSAYDIADIQIPGIVSRGSGTTPTLIGTGPGEDKLVAIADFGDPVKVVVFWADAIPTDFEHKPGTKSRRIADQVSVRMGSRGTIESSFVGFGNEFVAYNQTPPHPVVEDGPAAGFTSMLTLGVTRPAPTGVEEFVWNKAERKLASVWVDRSVPMLVTVSTYNLPTQSLYIPGARDGVFGVYQLDWETGKQTGYIELGLSHTFNVLAGLAVPFGEGRVWLTGAYGPVLVRVR